MTADSLHHHIGQLIRWAEPFAPPPHGGDWNDLWTLMYVSAIVAVALLVGLGFFISWLVRGAP